MKTFLSLIFFFSLNSYASQKHLKNKPTKADGFAWAKKLDPLKSSSWPFEIESIGHSMQSFQKYGFSSAYWHDGLDMRGDAGTKIYASVSGTVVNIENYHPGNDLYWEVAILDDQGFVWKYHHVNKDSIPKKIKDAFKNKLRVEQGEYIGDIVTWPESAYGERYHHIHMLVVDGKGRFINPFKLLPKLLDHSAPVIKEIGLFDHKRRIIRGNTVRGEHGIFINAYDTVLHSKFNLTPYMISYRIDGGDEKIVWKFDTLPSIGNDRDYIHDFYLKGTCGNYHCRNFYINLNFNIKFKNNATEFFKFEKGQHKIDIKVSDFVGNSTSRSFLYQVE